MRGSGAITPAMSSPATSATGVRIMLKAVSIPATRLALHQGRQAPKPDAAGHQQQEGAAELEHEPDGGGIGLVAAPLETVMGIGHLGSG